MAEFTTKQLFRAITSMKDWFKYNNYCDANAAAVLMHRHKKNQLSEETYEKMFFHFGYKKQLIWTD
ncbi:MAG TPA: hypothetical protein VGM63_15140 [Mucilaginibacter sp.]|jgi:hypothetical protein